MSELQTRLQTAVGDTYRIEKELGGGGMSRVFLAEEVALERRVVIKLLPPEMAAGVSVERFEREIKLAAKLQHPHIVPLLTAGSKDDLLFYVMPYIEGESLRAKLTREGELPVGEAVRILKEVIDALSYAHSHGIVHRDIKPDNVLLSGKHAVVTDFGVAKAVSSSTAGQSLTSMGIALGTPAYMAPEQAAADPHVDHRADVYAVGVLAYEMLTGQPPFTGPNPQAVLSAHMTQAPDPVSIRRSTVPAALDGLIMRCLEKKAADRWQQAEELLPHLEGMTTPSGGLTPTGTQPVMAMTTSAAERAVKNAHPLRVIGLFGLASVGALAIVYFLVQLIGLPDWVFYGAIGLLAVGFPIVLLTGHREKQRAFATMTGMSMATPVGLERHFTWRKAIIGGGLAFVGLAVVAGVYMTMRVMGIGPVGTLVASGVLAEQSAILITEFQNHTSDSTLGRTLATLVRTDFGQSKVVKLVDQSTFAAALNRMQRNPGQAVDSALAMEVAEREGIPAIVTGDVSAVGSAFVVTASVISTANGAVLVAVTEPAKDDAGLITAIGKLSRKLRERIGESLKDIRSNPSLERVTTSSLPALRTYSQAIAAENLGDFRRAMALLDEAVGIDSAFAMAYRKLAVIRGNTFEPRPLVLDATEKAFRYRDRLPAVERYLTEARYYGTVEGDREKEMDAYRSVLAIDPHETTSLNNLANGLNIMKRYEEAEPYALRALEQGNNWVFYANVITARAGQGKWQAAEEMAEQLRADLGDDSPHYGRFAGDLAAAQGQFERADSLYRSVLDTRNETFWQIGASMGSASIDFMRGKLAGGEAHIEHAMEEAAVRPGGSLAFAMMMAQEKLRFHDDRVAALGIVRDALEREPLSDVSPLERPYSNLAMLYVDLGEPDTAQALLDEYKREVDETFRRSDLAIIGAEAAVAAARGQLDAAIAGFRRWDAAGDGFCKECAMFRVADVFDRVEQPDSAIVAYEVAINANNLYRQYEDWSFYPQAHKRLGELYEQSGNKDKAIEYYNKFVELWKDADAELQPQVKDVRDRIARLVGER